MNERTSMPWKVHVLGNYGNIEMRSKSDAIGKRGYESMSKPVENVYVLLGQRIRHLREMNGMTQDVLARIVGQSRPSLVNIEHGKQRIMIHDLELYAQALQLPVSKFLRGIIL